MGLVRMSAPNVYGLAIAIGGAARGGGKAPAHAPSQAEGRGIGFKASLEKWLTQVIATPVRYINKNNARNMPIQS